MDLFNIICGVCSIAGLLVSLFTASQVVKITNNFNCGNKEDCSKNEVKVSRSTISGSVAGRDINGTGDKNSNKRQ